MTWRALGVIAACVVVAACGSGESILEAGKDPVATTTTTMPAAAPTPTAPVGETLPPTTPPPAATSTTTPLASLPPCPVDALDTATAPVEITLWFGLSADVADALVALADEYNASQDRVRVRVENQGTYKDVIDKFAVSSTDGRPHLAVLPEYNVQQMADSGAVIPAGACIAASGFDTSAFLPRALRTYETEGVQWAMPFNLSVPILYYNRAVFEAAGLDPDDPPVSMEEVRATSQAIVDSGAATYGLVVDSGFDSGGGWFLEQWFARAGEPYADNGNGRLAPATEVLFDGPLGVSLLTEVESLIDEGLAFNVGDNPGGQNALLKLADKDAPGAMAIATSAGLSSVLTALGGGLIEGFTPEQVGVGAMPGPGDTPSVTAGGGSLYVVAGKGDAEAAAAWDFVQYATSAQTQSTWAAATGYVPVRSDAVELEPISGKYAADPRFKVALTSLLAGKDDLSSLGPILGPQLEVRLVAAGAIAEIFKPDGVDVATALTAAATQANALIADYNARN